jgi:hypothetical protein
MFYVITLHGNSEDGISTTPGPVCSSGKLVSDQSRQQAFLFTDLGDTPIPLDVTGRVPLT